MTDIDKARKHLLQAERQQRASQYEVERALAKYTQACVLVGRLEEWVEELERKHD